MNKKEEFDKGTPFVLKKQYGKYRYELPNGVPAIGKYAPDLNGYYYYCNVVEVTENGVDCLATWFTSRVRIFIKFEDIEFLEEA